MPAKPVRVEVASELAASVQSVSVAVGDRVEAGTTLVMLESMKMEIPVLAENPGEVLEVRVSAGDSVQDSDVLVVLSPA